jgi:hypothetical protein
MSKWSPLIEFEVKQMRRKSTRAFQGPRHAVWVYRESNWSQYNHKLIPLLQGLCQ